MRTERGEYKKGEIPKCAIEPCPVCGADAELWLFSDDFENGPINKLMMCTNGEKFGPQEGFMNEGCLLYMPPDEFHRHRAADAVKFWNEYARALVAQRDGRRPVVAEIVTQSGSVSEPLKVRRVGYVPIGRDDDGRRVAILEYAAQTELAAKGNVLFYATTKEGFRGSADERMELLGWTVEPVFITDHPANQSTEANEQRKG